MEIEIVKWFQSFSCNFLDVTNKLVTQFGESIFFICIFLMLFWCFSYDKAFKFSIFYACSVIINAGLKMAVNRPRPWMASNEIMNKLPASKSSFPSGHSQSVSAISTFICYGIFNNKDSKKWHKTTSVVVAVVLCLCVAMSRLYLGQHYLTDVIAGLLFGAIIMLSVNFLYDFLVKKYNFKLPKILILSAVSVILLIALTVVSVADLGIESDTMFKIFKYAGVIIGGSIGFIFSLKLIPEKELNVWEKLIKLGAGYLITFSTFFLLNLIPSSNVVIFVIMLFTSFVATFIYPLLFNYIYDKFKRVEQE